MLLREQQSPGFALAPWPEGFQQNRSLGRILHGVADELRLTHQSHQPRVHHSAKQHLCGCLGFPVIHSDCFRAFSKSAMRPLRGDCGALLIRGLGFGIEPLLNVVAQQLLKRELLACTIIRFAHALVRTMQSFLLLTIYEFN